MIKTDISLAKYCTFGIGGPADFFTRVQTKEELQEALQCAAKKELSIFFLGGGSNTVFADSGYRGLVCKMENKRITQDNPVLQYESIDSQDSSRPSLKKSLLQNPPSPPSSSSRQGGIRADTSQGGMFVVESGVMNASLFQTAKKAGYDYSPLLPVPGTVGGAIVGNAGAHGKEMKDFFVSAELYDREEKQFFTAEKDFFDFSYRHSRLKTTNRYLIWSATLQLPSAEPESIRQAQQEWMQKRRETQPSGRTGGSFFKNPAEGAAGYFLDQAGAKGMCVGGAYISEKHANFFMNDGTASQKDLFELAKQAKALVQEKFGVTLDPEVRLLDKRGEAREI